MNYGHAITLIIREGFIDFGLIDQNQLTFLRAHKIAALHFQRPSQSRWVSMTYHLSAMSIPRQLRAFQFIPTLKRVDI